MRRSILLLSVAVCAASVLTACGPRKSVAVVGMSVDNAGAPVIVLQNCGGDISQLELYDQTRPRVEETGPIPLVSYVNPRPDKSVVRIPIQTGGDGWQVVGEAPALRADGKYEIQAWGERHEWFGRGTDFTLGDLKTVKPGLIRHDSPPADPPYDATPPKFRVTGLDGFITDECP
jgi:hypothetical protein